jgi:hypothetical protein
VLQDVNRALECWADYLLDKSADEGPYSHHLILWNVGLKPEALTTCPAVKGYLLHGTDAMVAVYQGQIAIFVNLAGILVWSAIDPPDPLGWHNTRIAASGAIRGPQLTPDSFVIFLAEHAEIASRVYSSRLSENQRRAIEARGHKCDDDPD